MSELPEKLPGICNTAALVDDKEAFLLDDDEEVMELAEDSSCSHRQYAPLAVERVMERVVQRGFVRNKLTAPAAFSDPDTDGPLALSPMPEGDLRLERIRAARIGPLR
jgi:hypothetical protein